MPFSMVWSDSSEKYRSTGEKVKTSAGQRESSEASVAWTCFWLKLVEIKRSVELRLIWTPGTCLEMKMFYYNGGQSSEREKKNPHQPFPSHKPPLGLRLKNPGVSSHLPTEASWGADVPTGCGCFFFAFQNICPTSCFFANRSSGQAPGCLGACSCWLMNHSVIGRT